MTLDQELSDLRNIKKSTNESRKEKVNRFFWGAGLVIPPSKTLISEKAYLANLFLNFSS